jgi:uncharacterized RDD family membrane protein YckC
MSQHEEKIKTELPLAKFSTRFMSALVDLVVVVILNYALITSITLLFPNKVPLPFNVKEETIETPFEVKNEGDTIITKSTVIKRKYDKDRLISECTTEKTTRKSGSIETSSWHNIAPCKTNAWELKELFFLVMFIYGIYFEMYPRSATFGKKLMRIHVLKVDGAPLTPRQTILRNLVKLFFIGFILALFTAKKQGLHDLVAKTIVVQSTPKSPT